MSEPSAAVAVLHARGPVESVLLMRRAERADDPWSGHWSFPGGRRDPADPDLLHTAIRELREECSVDVERAHFETALTPMSARRKGAPPFTLVAPFVFRLESQLDAVPDLHEAVDARWVSLAYLRDPIHHRLRSIPGLPSSMLFPSVELTDMPLWGFTYRVISEWLGLLPPARERTAATRAMADDVLRRLAGDGWNGNVAQVDGAIPVANVVEALRASRSEVPAVSGVEVTEAAVRISGLAFEEFVIQSKTILLR